MPFPKVSLDALSDVVGEWHTGSEAATPSTRYDELMDILLRQAGCTSKRLTISSDGAYSTLYCALPDLNTTKTPLDKTLMDVVQKSINVERIICSFKTLSLNEIVSSPQDEKKGWFSPSKLVDPQMSDCA